MPESITKPVAIPRAGDSRVWSSMAAEQVLPDRFCNLVGSGRSFENV